MQHTRPMLSSLIDAGDDNRLTVKYPWIVYTDLNGLFCKMVDGPLTSADHVGRLEEERRGDREPERLSGLQVDDQLERHRLLHR
jgi:hypothetical protein